MASILETFLILFESNADDVQKGADKAEQSSSKLEQSLKSVDGMANKTGESFIHMASKAAGAIASVLSVAAITSAVMAAADNADALGEFSERLGLNIEEVNAWGDAVAVNGGTAEAFRGSIDALADSITTFAVKGTSRAAPFFEELGIKMVDVKGKARDVMDILPELAESFEKLTKQESAALGKKLGLDQGTIMLLQRGRREVEEQIKQQKELGNVSAESAEIAGDFNDAYDNTAKVFRSLFTIVGSTILPAFTKVLTGLQSVGKFMQKHSDFIVGLLIALGSAISFYVLPPLISMAAAAIVAFAPFILAGVAIAALAGAFALLYDDVMNFIDGNDSLIGQILTQYPIIGDVIQVLIDAVKVLWDAFSWVFNSILSVLQISAAGWGLLWDAASSFIGGIVNSGGVVSDVIQAWADMFSIFGDIAGGVFDFIGDKISGFIDLVKKGIGIAKDLASAFTFTLESKKAELGIGAAQSAIGFASSSPINSQTSSVTTNANRQVSKNTNVQTGNITIQTQATDAEGIAGAIGSSLNDQVRQAAAGFDDGVMA